MKEKITIIGGGISGITSALTLQLLGYKTKVYAEHLVDETTPEDPRFASFYPAASVIPHSVQTDKTDPLFSNSQNVFQCLLENGLKSVQLHRHYELFEDATADPPYASALVNYARVDELDPQTIPHRTKSVTLSGWVFDCLFTEWPYYIQDLYEWYKTTGGNIILKRIAPDEISELEGSIIVNCTGIWSSTLFEDPIPRRVIKGHLLHIKNAPVVYDSSQTISSYNYTAGKQIYTNPDGKPADLYFYPRQDGWILGGSRQPGTLDKQGKWHGKEHTDTITIDGLKIPRQIYELNKTIIKNTYGLDLEAYPEVIAKTGYRYVRDSLNHGLRLEETNEYGKRIIHNYGHGGAGVTLSWGCALKVACFVKQITGDHTENKSLVDRLKQTLNKNFR